MDLLTLFVWSFLASTILPLGSEPALVEIVRRRDAVALPVTIATVGNYLGAWTMYALTMSAVPALLLSWVPLLGDAIVAAAGVARIRFVPISLWTIAGKAARYAVLALVVNWSFS